MGPITAVTISHIIEYISSAEYLCTGVRGANGRSDFGEKITK
jgi:hypothetical protein